MHWSGPAIGFASVWRRRPDKLGITALSHRWIALATVWFVPTLTAQPDSTWQTAATGKVSFTQTGFQRWYDGGVNSLALGTGLLAEFQRETHAWSQSHEARLAYGMVRQNGIDLRKAEDIIHLRSEIALGDHVIAGIFSPALTVELRTQFADGFSYRDADAPVQVSGSLSPATITQSVGLKYAELAWAEVSLGLTAKETVVTRSELRDRYKVKPDAVARWEGGGSLELRVDADVFENVRLRHSASVFASFSPASNPDLFSETLITMRINSWLQVNAEYAAVYDRDVSRSVQMREVVSVGFAINLL